MRRRTSPAGLLDTETYRSRSPVPLLPDEQSPEHVFRALASEEFIRAEGQIRAFAFLSNGGVSVDHGGRATPQQTATRTPRKPGVCALPLQTIADEGLFLQPDPLPQNDAHCLIVRAQGDLRKLPDGVAKRLARAASIVIEPTTP